MVKIEMLDELLNSDIAIGEPIFFGNTFEGYFAGNPIRKHGSEACGCAVLIPTPIIIRLGEDKQAIIETEQESLNLKRKPCGPADVIRGVGYSKEIRPGNPNYDMYKAILIGAGAIA